jgi:hypothetical protein
LWRGGNAPAAGKVHGVRLEETPMRSPVLVMISALLVGGAAQAAEPAQAPVVTAPAAAPSTADQIDAFIKTTPVPDVTKDKAAGATSTTDAPDRKIHGVVELGIGTGGYRHAYARADMPVGENGQLSIAVDQTRFNDRLRGRFGRFGTGPYGAGPYGGTSLSFSGAWLADGAEGGGPPCRARADGDLSRPDYGSVLPSGACRIVGRGAP